MLLSLEERQVHLDLSESCDEFGCSHSDYRAVLAWYLKTTCTRMGKETGLACHACNNRLCGNPKHLYWGTAKENMADLKVARPDRPLKVRDTILAKNPNHYREMALKRKPGNRDGNKRTNQEVQAMLEQIKHLDPKEWGFFTRVGEILGMTPQSAGRFYRRVASTP